MKRFFAVPIAGGKACAHFGRCEAFAIVEVTEQGIVGQSELTPPAHQPGVYPRFLAEAGVGTVIAGGMGGKARELFRQNNIEVHMGVGSSEPQQLVARFLRDELETGPNLCSHGDQEDHEHRCRH